MTTTEIADEIDRIKQMVEKLDQAITKLAIAVEQDEEAGQAESAPAEPTKPKVKIEDVRAALTALAGAKGGAAVKALLKDFSAEKLSDVAAQDYAQLLEAAKWKGE